MAKITSSSLILTVICVVLSDYYAYGSIGVKTSLSGFWRITINNKEFLWNDRSFVVVNDQIYTSDNNLNLDISATKTDVLSDGFGTWDTISYIYYADNVPFQFSVKSNRDRPVVIFTQKYLQDVTITADIGNFTASGFPSFQIPFYGDYGFLGYGGNWAGKNFQRTGRFRSDVFYVDDGVSGSGPLCVFDESGNAVVISPLNNFLTASTFFNDRRRFVSSSLFYGINKDVKFIPAGYEQQTVMYYSSEGINAAFEDWGSFLQQWYKKPVDASPLDLSLETLGYWMDYGSYYYNNIPKNMTYEDTVLLIQSSLYPQLPLQYIELDDWWYRKDDSGMLAWEPNTQSLPHGFKIINGQLHINTVLNAGQWSSNNVYSTKNGGNFTFVGSGNTAVPTQEAFWDKVFEMSKSMGMKAMVQDDLMEQMLSINELRSDLTAGRQWLEAMGNSARRNGIPIQYSSALPSHALQTLEIPAVTQIRVSDNYMRETDQWKIGITSILANALGLAPSKDTFWNANVEPGNIYNTTEKRPFLQNLMATLSMGPVGIGDDVDFNMELNTMRCCREDGIVLRPSRPLTSSDAQITKMALNVSSTPTGELMSTQTTIGNLTFGTITVVEAKNVKLTPSFIFNKNESKESVIYLFYSFNAVFPFSEDQPFILTSCGFIPPYFCLAFTSPTIYHKNRKVNILGEPNKWAPISPQRIANITIGDDIVVTVKGKAGYLGNFVYAIDGITQNVTFVIKSNGLGEITIHVPPSPSTTPTPRLVTDGSLNSGVKSTVSLSCFALLWLSILYHLK